MIRAVIVLIAAILAFYLFLLSAEAYSAWQASRMLERLEAIRLGDPVSTFQEAVQGCRLQASSSGWYCEVIAGPYDFARLDILLSKLPEHSEYRLQALLNRLGLRHWRFVAFSSAVDGRIESLSADLYVVGRYEALGASWEVSEHVPDRYVNMGLVAKDSPTYMRPYHITSVPSGEGYKIHVTPASTLPDLAARRINRRCFLSFRGCDGLCELLPQAASLLRERRQTFGICSSIPSSWCEIKTGDCPERLSY